MVNYKSIPNLIEIPFISFRIGSEQTQTSVADLLLVSI